MKIKMQDAGYKKQDRKGDQDTNLNLLPLCPL